MLAGSAAGVRHRTSRFLPILAGLSPAKQKSLRMPMHFTLGAGGVLRAEGAIDAGAAERLAAELDARGEYVRKVSLNSPGGVLEEAIAMAKLLRAAQDRH